MNADTPAKAAESDAGSRNATTTPNARALFPDDLVRGAAHSGEVLEDQPCSIRSKNSRTSRIDSWMIAAMTMTNRRFGR
jgi:hypothetical protein